MHILCMSLDKLSGILYEVLNTLAFPLITDVHLHLCCVLFCPTIYVENEVGLIQAVKSGDVAAVKRLTRTGAVPTIQQIHLKLTHLLSVHFDGVIDTPINKPRPPATNRQN